MNEAAQWIAITLIAITVVPYVLGFRNCTLADMDSLAGAARRKDRGGPREV